MNSPKMGAALVDTTTHTAHSRDIFYEDHLMGVSSGVSDSDDLGKMQEGVSVDQKLGTLTYSP